MQAECWGRGHHVALALVAVLLIAPGYPSGPRVDLMSGSVEIGTGDPPVWRQAHEGDPLQPGDVVRTGHNGRAELALPAGTVRLYEDSVLRLPSAWEKDGSTETVGLEEGSSLFNIFKRDPSEPFSVETREAVVMVKGTLFSVALDSSGASVAVYEGTVGVSAPDSSDELLVHEGFAAVGGSDHPFELALTSPDSDPWETWDDGGEAPTAPTEVMEEMPTTSDLDSAKTATYAAVEADLNLAPEFEVAIVPESSGATDGTTSDPTSLDPVADAPSTEFEQEFREQFMESTLGGTGSSYDVSVILFGGNNFVQVSGLPSGTVQLDEGALDQVIGGNSTPLGPDLPVILNTEGIDPVVWAEELQHLL